MVVLVLVPELVLVLVALVIEGDVIGCLRVGMTTAIERQLLYYTLLHICFGIKAICLVRQAHRVVVGGTASARILRSYV